MSCASCVRIFMIVFNFLFTIIGFILLAGALFFFFTETGSKLSDSGPQLNSLGYILLAVAAIGCITLLLGILGCCGAFHYSRCILSFYFILLLLLFAAEIASGVIAFHHKQAVKSEIDSILEKTFRERSNSKIITIIESYFECCGYATPSLSSLTCSAKAFNTMPCKNQLELITDNIFVIFGIFIALALFQFVGLIFASILCCAAKDRVEYTQYHPVYQFYRSFIINPVSFKPPFAFPRVHHKALHQLYMQYL